MLTDPGHTMNRQPARKPPRVIRYDTTGSIASATFLTCSSFHRGHADSALRSLRRQVVRSRFAPNTGYTVRFSAPLRARAPHIASPNPNDGLLSSAAPTNTGPIKMTSQNTIQMD